MLSVICELLSGIFLNKFLRLIGCVVECELVGESYFVMLVVNYGFGMIGTVCKRFGVFDCG